MERTRRRRRDLWHLIQSFEFFLTRWKWGGGDGTGADTQKQPHTHMPATALGAPLRNQPRQPAAGVTAKHKTQCQRKMNSYMICDGNWSPYLGLVKLMQRLLGGCSMVEFAMVWWWWQYGSFCIGSSLHDVLVIASEGRRASVNELWFYVSLEGQIEAS